MYRVFPRAFFNWCVATSLGRSVASSTWSFPILETFHIMGLTLVLGAVFVLNLTVLGVGVRAPGDILAKQMLPWGLAGLLISVGTGVPMFMSAATSYSINGPFAVKMILLIGAIAVQVAIHLVPGSYRGSRTGRLAACVSLLCWFGVAYAGRAIAFTNLLGVQ